MPETNMKEASVSLDDTDRRVKIVFEHLPRAGDYIRHADKTYTVVFNSTESSLGLFGYPNIFCRPTS
jgi:hypothetical protein